MSNARPHLVDLRKGSSAAERLAMLADHLGVKFNWAGFRCIRGQFGYIRTYEREFIAATLESSASSKKSVLMLPRLALRQR